MNENEIQTRVRGVVVKVANLPVEKRAIDPDADLFRDLGIASTAALDLLLSLEEEFDVSIPDQEFGDARTVRALSGLIGGLK